MTPSPTSDMRLDFAERDAVLHLLLGLLGATDRLTSLLDEVAPAAEAERGRGSPFDHPMSMALLGVVAVHRRLVATLDTCLPAPSRTVADAPDETPAPELSRLLR